MPRLSNPTDSDFQYIAAKEPEDIRKEVLKYVTRVLPTEFGFDPKKDIQVLSPMRKGSCGIEQLNLDLQAFFSTSSIRKWHFSLGDKVIQKKNNYNKEVFNGDVGFVTDIDEKEESITVAFDEKAVTYVAADIDELSLAWAVSVHKFQGSECPCIVLPIHTQHFKLLNRNLLYTAVTRGKKLVIVIGSAKAIAIAVHQETKEARWTNLKSALLQESLV
jgi:exodeoxyribonuclease V alpha subunit